MPMQTRGKRVDYRALAGLKTKTVKMTRKVKVRPLSAPVQAAVQSVVKRQIARAIENKRVGFKVEDFVPHNSPVSAGDCVPLIGQIEQTNPASGNNSLQRTGDKLMPKSLRVRGIVALRPDTQTSTQSLYVRVMILAQKDLKVGSQVQAGQVDAAHLLSPDYNTAPGIDQQAYDGSTASTFMPINTDKFRVYYDRVFKLSPATNATVQNELNCFRWSYTFKKSKLPQSLTYDAGNGDWINNFAPFLAIGYAYADGTAPDTVNTKIRSHCDATLTWEDA